MANQALEARRAELERRLGQDSSSSRPPSQDGLRKPTRHGRGEQSRRRPGKQPSTAGAHLARVADPDEVVVHAPARCGGCGGVLARFQDTAVLQDPQLAFLGDVFFIPASWPLSNVFSVGDVLLALGVVWALHRICGSRLAPSRARRP